MKMYFKILLLILSPLILTGCNNKHENKGPTITINHEFGTTEVPVNVEKVITLEPGDFETALALGVKPIATGSYLSYRCLGGENCSIRPWVQTELEKYPGYNPQTFHNFVMNDSIDFELQTSDEQLEEYETIDLDKREIKKLKPDLIIAPFSRMEKGEYEDLSAIAPTVPSLYDFSQPQRWQDATRMVAACLNKREEGEILINNIEQLINSKIKQYPALQDKTVAYIISGNQKNYNARIIGQNYYYINFLEDLGLQIDPNLSAIVNGKTKEWITDENVSMLNDTDIIILDPDVITIDDLKSGILSQVPAIQRYSIVYISDETLKAAIKDPTVLSIPYFIDNYLSLLNDAAMKVN